MSAWRVEDSGIASSNKEFMPDLLAIINLQILLKKKPNQCSKNTHYLQRKLILRIVYQHLLISYTQPIIIGCTVKRNYYELYKS